MYGIKMCDIMLITIIKWDFQKLSVNKTAYSGKCCHCSKMVKMEVEFSDRCSIDFSKN